MFDFTARRHPSLQSPVSSLQKTHNRVRETGNTKRETKLTAWLATGDWRLATSLVTGHWLLDTHHQVGPKTIGEVF